MHEEVMHARTSLCPRDVGWVPLAEDGHLAAVDNQLSALGEAHGHRRVTVEANVSRIVPAERKLRTRPHQLSFSVKRQCFLTFHDRLKMQFSLEHIDHVVQRHERVVDGHHLGPLLQRSPEHKATDSTESVDADLLG